MTRPDRSSVCLLVLALGGAAASALFLLEQQQEAITVISGACWFVIIVLVLERAWRDPPAKALPVEIAPPSSGQRALNGATRATSSPDIDPTRRLEIPPCAPHRLTGCMMCARRALGVRQLPVQDAEPTVMVRMEER